MNDLMKKQALVDALNILDKTRQKVIHSDPGGVVRPMTLTNLGTAWIWKVLHNAGEHLLNRANPNRTDFTLFFDYDEMYPCITNE
jgi:hypothetical protein